MQDTVGARSVETKTRVFISYSRKDMAFADKLEAALKGRGFDVLIDRQEIYAFEDWWKRIEALIGRADTVVFVLSPDAVASEVALKEVAHAASLNKRFAPIICRRVEDSAVPDTLRRLNFIFFDDPNRFHESTEHLAEALRTDIGWVRQHTEYGEAERRWSAAGRPNSLLLRSPTLDVAEYWMGSRPAGAPEPTGEIQLFVAISRKAEVAGRRRNRILNVTLYTLLVGIILGLVGWINQVSIANEWRFLTVMWPYERTHVRPYVLSAVNEQTLKPGDTFRECAPKQQDADYCPDMVVVPAGSFTMGGPMNGAQPQHAVTIAKSFAVSKYELTFADWDACVAGGGCNGYEPGDHGWGRGQQPVINVNWDDAQAYVAWLSQVTGKTYRLLSEAEYEYATRAGTTTTYPWGDDIKLNGQAMANCSRCGSKWDLQQTAPVGSFYPNEFGLYDMVGNVWEWTEDCVRKSYNGAPTDGSAWLAKNGDDCTNRVLRGGSMVNTPDFLRSAFRNEDSTGSRLSYLGFRVVRTLDVAALTEQQLDQIERQQQSNWCTNENKSISADLQIAGCTALIQSGDLSGEELARAYDGRGDAYVFKKDYARANADLGEAITLDPKNADFLNDRCWNYAVADQLQAALADCNHSLQLRPNGARTLNSRGFTYLKLGQFDNAIADYSAALKIDPKNAFSLYWRGVAELKKGDSAAGNADITAAKAIWANVAEQMVALGIRL